MGSTCFRVFGSAPFDKDRALTEHRSFLVFLFKRGLGFYRVVEPGVQAYRFRGLVFWWLLVLLTLPAVLTMA